jgi:hypothetical protein
MSDKNIGQLGWSVAAAVAATIASHLVLRWLAEHTDLGDDDERPDPSTANADTPTAEDRKAEQGS